MDIFATREETAGPATDNREKPLFQQAMERLKDLQLRQKQMEGSLRVAPGLS